MKIEEEYEEKKRHCEALEEQLNSLKDDCTKTEHNFTAEIAELQPLSKQLKVLMTSLYSVYHTDCVRLKLRRNRSS